MLTPLSLSLSSSESCSQFLLFVRRKKKNIIGFDMHHHSLDRHQRQHPSRWMENSGKILFVNKFSFRMSRRDGLSLWKRFMGLRDEIMSATTNQQSNFIIKYATNFIVKSLVHITKLFESISLKAWKGNETVLSTLNRVWSHSIILLSVHIKRAGNRSQNESIPWFLDSKH